MTEEELKSEAYKAWLHYEEPYLYESAFKDGFIKGYELYLKSIEVKE
jgi:hypothetical protein